MEGMSMITYQDKLIFYWDYSGIGSSKEKVLQLLQSGMESYQNQQLPPKSVLAMVNVANLHYDLEIINAFKASRVITVPYEKKIAVIGIKGLQRLAFHSIVCLSERDFVKTFNSELEAKEWLVSDG